MYVIVWCVPSFQLAHDVEDDLDDFDLPRSQSIQNTQPKKQQPKLIYTNPYMNTSMPNKQIKKGQRYADYVTIEGRKLLLLKIFESAVNY